MKLGRDTGSTVNYVMGRTGSPAPKIGDGATLLMWTDRHAATVVEVSKNGKKVAIQADTAIRTDTNGFSESQEYRYERNPNAPVRWFSLRKRGNWVEVKGSQRLAIGFRESYHDFSF